MGDLTPDTFPQCLQPARASLGVGTLDQACQLIEGIWVCINCCRVSVEGQAGRKGKLSVSGMPSGVAMQHHEPLCRLGVQRCFIALYLHSIC